jgi:hypothetical protein
VQDTVAADPGFGPFVLVEVDSVDVINLTERSEKRLLVGLVLQELTRGFGENEADGEVGVVGEGV